MIALLALFSWNDGYCVGSAFKYRGKVLPLPYYMAHSSLLQNTGTFLVMQILICFCQYFIGTIASKREKLFLCS